VVSDFKGETQAEGLRILVLRIMFGPKTGEVTGGWRKLYNEELDNLCASPIIIRTTRPKTMRRVGNAVRMGENKLHIGY
jgi:hypothetical protein